MRKYWKKFNDFVKSLCRKKVDTFDYFIADLTMIAAFYDSIRGASIGASRKQLEAFQQYQYATFFGFITSNSTLTWFRSLCKPSALQLCLSWWLWRCWALFSTIGRSVNLSSKWEVSSGVLEVIKLQRRRNCWWLHPRWWRRSFRFICLSSYLVSSFTYFVRCSHGCSHQSVKLLTTYKLPMPGFTNETRPVYAMNYALQVSNIISIGMPTALIDILQTAFYIQCGVQVSFLIELLKPLVDFKEDNSDEVKDILKKVYELHLNLKSFVAKTSGTFLVINTLQLFHSGFLLCVSVYLFSALPEAERTIEPFFFVLSIMSQLTVYCFIGQHLTNKFEELYDTMLQVCWYGLSKGDKVSYLIMLRNMQQPVVIRSLFNDLSVVVYRNVRVLLTF